MKIKKRIVKIEKLENLKNSVYGNPRYLVTFTENGLERTGKTKTGSLILDRVEE